MSGGVKFGRAYDDAERALFARYINARAKYTPKQCTEGDECWVRCGPPCYRTNNHGGHCAGCGGSIVVDEARSKASLARIRQLADAIEAPDA